MEFLILPSHNSYDVRSLWYDDDRGKKGQGYIHWYTTIYSKNESNEDCVFTFTCCNLTLHHGIIIV